MSYTKLKEMHVPLARMAFEGAMFCGVVAVLFTVVAVAMTDPAPTFFATVCWFMTLFCMLMWCGHITTVHYYRALERINKLDLRREPSAE